MQRGTVVAELRKGFLLDNGRLMLTPAIQYGFQYWHRTLTGLAGYDDHYTHNWIGGALHADYALTHSLVLRAEASVGDSFANRIHAPRLVDNDFILGSRPVVYSVELGADEVLSRRLHPYVDASPTHISTGRSTLQPANFTTGRLWEPASCA
ncbi:MAG: hypothetical protein ACRYFY_05110 [Janthinobacterium lividum]